VKSALVNAAARVVTDHLTGTGDARVLARGGGREHLPAADATSGFVSPVSASFGLGKGNEPISATFDLVLRGANVSCGVTVTGGGGRVTAPATIVATPAGAPLTLTLNGGRADETPSGEYGGDVELDCGATDLRAARWTRVERNGNPRSDAGVWCGRAPAGALPLPTLAAWR
jgi:hypothetical protein